MSALEDRSQARNGNPEILRWCPKCEELCVPMRDDTCGFCDGATVDPPAETWPHTESVVRRQVVHVETVEGGPREAAAVKRRHEGDRAHGPILAPPLDEPTEIESEIAAEMGSNGVTLDPRRSPILDWLEQHGTGSASQIADDLDRKPANVSTRLRQLERGGFVRRTGSTVPGGRGGPQIEWELAREDKPPTGPEDVLDSPQTIPADPREAMRHRYFEALLSMVEREDCPAHIFDRLEKLCGLDS